MVVFIYVIVLHFEVLDLQPRLGVPVRVQESIIEGVEEIKPSIWVFVANVESVSLDPDEVSDEGARYESEGEGYFALIRIQRLYSGI